MIKLIVVAVDNEIKLQDDRVVKDLKIVVQGASIISNFHVIPSVEFDLS